MDDIMTNKPGLSEPLNERTCRKMKTLKPAIATVAFITVLFFLWASSGFAAQGATDKTTAKDVKEKTADALRSIASYTADQRDEAVKKAKDILTDLDTRIDRLESQVSQKWDRMDQAARMKSQEMLTELRRQRTKAAEWYGALKQSSSSAWEEVKSGFLKSYHDLQEAFDKASQKF